MNSWWLSRESLINSAIPLSYVSVVVLSRISNSLIRDTAALRSFASITPSPIIHMLKTAIYGVRDEMICLVDANEKTRMPMTPVHAIMFIIAFYYRNRHLKMYLNTCFFIKTTSNAQVQPYVFFLLGCFLIFFWPLVEAIPLLIKVLT